MPETLAHKDLTAAAIKSSSSRIPSLDGIRAVSITLVMVYHLTFVTSLAPYGLLGTLASHGGFGVDVFFVLSGFLITYLLLVEEARIGGICIRRFYQRRALRILPPAFLYLLAVAIAELALASRGQNRFEWRDLLASALFCRNFYDSYPVQTDHYWSLSVEEQFYIIWPFLLIALKDNSRRLKLTIALLVFSPFWRFLNIFLAGGRHINYWRSDLTADALIVGCILALLRSDARALRAIQRPFFVSGLAAIVAAILMLSAVTGFMPLSMFLGRSTSLLCVAFLINYFIEQPAGLAGRVLNSAPVTWIGRLSFSLYLWQQPFVFTYNGGPKLWIREFPQNVIAALACACGSYYLVEQPFARIRNRIHQRTFEKPNELAGRISSGFEPTNAPGFRSRASR